MITDNFDRIADILKFENENHFYFLQIIQRKKDGCNCDDSANNGYRTIKSYYIRSVEDLMRRKEKIVELCSANNARAYINLNRRDARKVSLAAAKTYIDLVAEDRCHQGFRVWDHACGITRDSTSQKYWIVDVDTKNNKEIHDAVELIDNCRSSNSPGLFGGYDNVKFMLPTPNGTHLITTPFDPRDLQGKYEIKKDNPTVLYYAGMA